MLFMVYLASMPSLLRLILANHLTSNELIHNDFACVRALSHLFVSPATADDLWTFCGRPMLIDRLKQKLH